MLHEEGFAVTEHKRSLGAYYSPEPYARLLVRWALNGRAQALLDPSYGGCAVLRVAIDELAAVGAPKPQGLIHGADIDGTTAKWTAHLISQGVPARHLVAGDFLSLEPGGELPVVGAVVGNPPYVRHHRLSAAAKRAAVASARAAGTELDGRSSLWAYFVVHAARFVQTGGRMALLLPGAVTHADYASDVLEHLERCFEDVRLVRIRERIFDDAQEESVVLLASGARDRGNRVSCQFAEVDDLAGLERMLAAPARTSPQRRQRVIEGVSQWKLELVSGDCIDILEELLAHDHVEQLGGVARVRLGTVTGANDVFVLTDDEVDRLNVRHWSTSVVRRAAWLDQPTLDADRFEAASASDPRLLLVLPSDLRVDRRTRLGRYLSDAEKAGVADRHHCRRTPWWALRNVATPDGFLPYTVAMPRGLTLNGARAASTNTIHQVSWLAGPPPQRLESWVLSTWSTIGRLCTELYGRHLGGGVLKLELSAAQRLPVIDCDWAQIPPLLDLANTSAACAAADKLVVSGPLGLRRSDLTALGAAASMLAERRVGRHAHREWATRPA
jgi:hypothetical protein